MTGLGFHFTNWKRSWRLQQSSSFPGGEVTPEHQGAEEHRVLAHETQGHACQINGHSPQIWAHIGFEV